MLIRVALPNDADRIAKVHVATWQSAYRGIVADDHLDSLTVEACAMTWQDQLTPARRSKVATFVAESAEQGVVGFACGGRNRGQEPEFDAEIYAIYVLRAHQRRGVGRQLINALAAELARRQHHGLIVWVLAGSRARQFYEVTGGVLVGERPVTIDDTKYAGVAYGWRALRSLVSL